MVPARARTILVVFFFFFFLPLSFLSHHVVASASFSFDFSNASTYRLQDLRFEGDAALNQNGNLVDLTCNSMEPDKNYHCKGRMSYNHPVVLYDDITGEVASFTTRFTFAIHMMPNKTEMGDGMAFFLSAYPSRLPSQSSGSALGLANTGNISATGADRFIAVEFDTYENTGLDRTGASDHLGIDINSVISVNTTMFSRHSLKGTMMATITFDSTTRTLEATLHFDSDRSLPAFRVQTQLPNNLNDLLPPEVAVGLSASTGEQTELHQVQSWSFNSSMAPRGGHGPDGDGGGGGAGDNNSVIIGGAVAGVLALLLVVVAIWWIVSRCMCMRTRDSFGSGTRLKHIEYRDLSIATEGFSEKNEIGQGGFGVVYKGSLKKKKKKKKLDVAVKRILKDSTGDFKDFLAELGAIDGTCHVNVVRLEGWCCHIDNPMFWWSHKNIKLFLVYELVPNGNLHQHLHADMREAAVLPWKMRYKIVKGIGSALRYLHHDCNPYILHRDVKPSNILLDDDFNAKLGDFGLSRVAQDSVKTSVQTMAVGTRAYMDPECMKHEQVKFRPSSDVYSFGVVLLEIAHGENNLAQIQKLCTDRPATFVTDVADKKLAGQFDPTEMERIILLGIRCCEQEDNRRPSMVGVMQLLEKGTELRPATSDE